MKDAEFELARRALQSKQKDLKQKGSWLVRLDDFYSLVVKNMRSCCEENELTKHEVIYI